MQLKLQIGLRQDLVAGGGALLGRGRGREKGGREGDLKRSVRSRAVDAGNLLKPALAGDEKALEWCYVKLYEAFMEALDAIDNGIEVAEGPLRYRDGSSLPGAGRRPSRFLGARRGAVLPRRASRGGAASARVEGVRFLGARRGAARFGPERRVRAFSAQAACTG